LHFRAPRGGEVCFLEKPEATVVVKSSAGQGRRKTYMHKKNRSSRQPLEKRGKVVPIIHFPG